MEIFAYLWVYISTSAFIGLGVLYLETCIGTNLTIIIFLLWLLTVVFAIWALKNLREKETEEDDND